MNVAVFALNMFFHFICRGTITKAIVSLLFCQDVALYREGMYLWWRHVCAYLYVHTICVCRYAGLRVYAFDRDMAYTHIYEYVSLYMCVWVCVYLHIYVFVCTRACMCVCDCCDGPVIRALESSISRQENEIFP